MRNIRVLSIYLTILAVLVALAAVPAVATEQARDPERFRAWLENEVRHELVMLPFYRVFDFLAFRVDGETVVLMGQVTRPTLRSDAENVVKRIEGVLEVKNEIEVLPLSPNDDRLRVALYRAIYGQTGLQRYAMRARPPIHIIVKGGHVTLEGAVGNEADRNVAGLQAKTVPGSFSVTNNLRVESSREK